MLTVKITALGKLKEEYLKSACAEYEKRLRRFSTFSIKELKEREVYEEANAAYIESALSKEAEDISSEMKGFYNIALCVEGKQMTSEEFAGFLSSTCALGTSRVNFIIGSSFGLSPQIKDKVDYKLSFSKMTFPHQLMRVILLEQLYRAFKINENESYHK